MYAKDGTDPSAKYAKSRLDAIVPGYQLAKHRHNILPQLPYFLAGVVVLATLALRAFDLSPKWSTYFIAAAYALYAMVRNKKLGLGR